MNRFKTGLKKDIGILLLDIIAVNVSYFLALLFRATVNGVGIVFAKSYYFPYYFNVFFRFAPIYTIACIIIFLVFRLYGGVWKYAGINDGYRILAAWFVTTVFQIVGTIIMIHYMDHEHGRMPLTYYLVGSALQLLFVAAIRFSRRFVTIEKKRRTKKSGKAIIVGAEELGTLTMKALQEGENYDVSAIVDTEEKHVGLLLNGVPVFGIETLDALLDKNDINCVFLAEQDLGIADRIRIAAACKNRNIELRERAVATKTVTEDQFIKPTTVMEGEWVRQYKEQFGDEPSFF